MWTYLRLAVSSAWHTANSALLAVFAYAALWFLGGSRGAFSLSHEFLTVIDLLHAVLRRLIAGEGFRAFILLAPSLPRDLANDFVVTQLAAFLALSLWRFLEVAAILLALIQLLGVLLALLRAVTQIGRRRRMIAAVRRQAVLGSAGDATPVQARAALRGKGLVLTKSRRSASADHQEFDR